MSERGEAKMEKAQIKAYANIEKQAGCPILSVNVSPWKYDYRCMELFSYISENALSEFESKHILGNSSEPEERILALASKYCSSVINAHMCGSSSFSETAEKLTRLSKYCKKHNPMAAAFAAKWLAGLYLINHKYTSIDFEKNCTDYFPFMRDYAVCAFIDAYFENSCDGMDKSIRNALKCLSDFDIEKSPAYAKNREMYGKVLSTVIKTILDNALSENGKSFLVPPCKTVKLQAFTGLFCSAECERKLEITYIPYSENNELSELLTPCVRYADNLIRQGLGISSKLVGFTILPEYRKLIQDTIREMFPDFLPKPMKVGRKPKEKTTTENTVKASESQYIPEPIDLNIDFAKAKKLEAESWKLASILGADYGGNDITFDPTEISQKDKEHKTDSDIEIRENPMQTQVSENIPEDWQEFHALLTEDEKKILCLIAKELSPSEFAVKRGGMLMGYADSINEKASDSYGDIILENIGASFAFLEDYKTELTDIYKDMYNTEVLK